MAEPAAHTGPHRGPVVVFDGYCNLCNSWVSFILARDRSARFRFATLQGDVGLSLIHAAWPDLNPGESVVLVEGDRAYLRSTAALRILGGLGLPWSLARVFLLVPRVLRDAIYELVARHRYQWFGRRASCRAPTPDERKRFL